MIGKAFNHPSDGKILVYKVYSPKMTAQGAAETFAECHWDKPRTIEGWFENRFTLVDGETWYEVISEGDGGWNIYKLPNIRGTP